jgi:plasmid stabilization system protein ParE
MKVIWTGEALEKLIDIQEFISLDSPVRADNFICDLIDQCELLPKNPRIGRMVPEILNPEIRELIVKKYRIVYRIKNEVIEILTVFEGHRLLKIDEIKLK